VKKVVLVGYIMGRSKLRQRVAQVAISFEL